MDRLSMAIWLSNREPALAHEGEETTHDSSQALSTTSQYNKEYLFNWVDVHLNFWLLPDDMTIDIGIMFPCIDEQTLNIYINTPSIDKDKIEDITGYLEQANIRNIIFNENVTIESTCLEERVNYCYKLQRIKNTDNKEAFCINCNLNKFDISYREDGILIKLKISNRKCKENVEAVYSRIRISGKELNNIFPFIIDPSSKWQYHITEYKFIDLRLNDIRTLPDGLCDYRCLPMIRHLRCFFMLDAILQMVCRSKKCEKVRCLENDLWKDYKDLPEKGNLAILAYQWNDDSSIITEKILKNFQLFLKIRKSYVKFQTVLKAFGLIIVLGALGSALSNIADYKCLLVIAILILILIVFYPKQ